MRTDRGAVALRILSATWRWYQQRGRLREGRALLAAALDPPGSTTDVRLRIAGLAADGGLAYWMEDFDGSRARYEERLRLAEPTGDPILEADAHSDIGFLFMVSGERDRLRAHETRAFELYRVAGIEAKVTLARQALVLVDFLGGDYAAARDHEQAAIEFFRRTGSRFQMADGMTLISAIHMQLGDLDSAWRQVTGALAVFSESDLASGLARSLVMAAILQLRFGDPELGARIAGTTNELGRLKNVMVAPAKVLHLPEPGALAAEVLGPERAAVLLAEGAATPLGDVIGVVLATSLSEGPKPNRSAIESSGNRP